MSDSLTVREAANVLEVTVDADTETIEDAYRAQAKEHHPDVSEDPNAVSRFRQIKHARDVLLTANRSLMDSSAPGADVPPSAGEQRWERTDFRSGYTEGAARSAESATEDGSTWNGEQWQKERVRNERAGRSRYRQEPTDNSDTDPSARRAHNEKRGGWRYGDGTARRQARSRTRRRVLNTTAFFQRIGQLVLILGIVVTLIPLGLGGAVLPVPIDSTAGFALSIGGITTGIAGHQWLSGVSRSTSQGGTNNDQHISFFPIVAANIIGVALAAFAYSRGFALAGSQFLFEMLTAAFVPGTAGFLLGGYVATMLASSRVPASERPVVDARSAIGGLIGLSIGLTISLVRVGTRGTVLHLAVRPANLAGQPWVPQLTVGSIGFTPLLNFIVGAFMLALLLGSTALTVWQFPQLRRRIAGSRARGFFRGYLGNLSWKLLLLLPVALFIWMRLVGQRTLMLPIGPISQATLGGVVLLLPTLLMGLALLCGRPSPLR